MSDPVNQDPILDQFSMITRPYTRLNGLKTIPIPAAHNLYSQQFIIIWEYPLGQEALSLIPRQVEGKTLGDSWLVCEVSAIG